MKQLMNDIMSSKVEMSFNFEEVQDACTELAKRTFLDVYVDTEKYPQYKKDVQKINVFGIGLWIFRCDTKKSFLKIAEENNVTELIPASIMQETGNPFDLNSLNHLGINDPVGIVEVALSSGMRNEFLYEDTNDEFVKFFDEWYRTTLFSIVKEKYNVTPIFKAEQTF